MEGRAEPRIAMRVQQGARPRLDADRNVAEIPYHSLIGSRWQVMPHEWTEVADRPRRPSERTYEISDQDGHGRIAGQILVYLPHAGVVSLLVEPAMRRCRNRVTEGGHQMPPDALREGRERARPFEDDEIAREDRGSIQCERRRGIEPDDSRLMIAIREGRATVRCAERLSAGLFLFGTQLRVELFRDVLTEIVTGEGKPVLAREPGDGVDVVADAGDAPLRVDGRMDHRHEFFDSDSRKRHAVSIERTTLFLPLTTLVEQQTLQSAECLSSPVPIVGVTFLRLPQPVRIAGVPRLRVLLRSRARLRR